jgi:nucleoside-diphosphate-sugar epimerase
MKKMLVVGGAGYIGGYMTDVFEGKEDYDVTVFDNLLYESHYMKDVKFIYGDIRDIDKLGRIINDYDIVVWLAAIVGDGACAINAAISEEVNYLSVKWLVDNYTKGTIVFTSTCSVYGMNSELIDEDAKPNPLSVYAATKLQAEQYIVENAKDYIIFRLGTLYGIGDSHSRLRLDLVVNILTLRAVQGENLTVFGGEQWRPILHVRDVSYAALYCLENNVRGLFNLSELNVVISGLSETIKRLFPGTNVIYQDMKFEDLRDYKVKNDRIMATGWKPKYTLDEGILEMIGIFKEGRIRNVSDPLYSNANYLKHIDFGK